MSIDIDMLTHSYFFFDEPVPYKTKTGELTIRPISLKESELFLYSVGILNIDKNSLPDAKIIQMSYLQFICQILLENEATKKINGQALYNILYLSLGIKKPHIKWLSKNKVSIVDDETGIEINSKEFDDIRKIILYQNFPHYDDQYVNPELKEAMDEVDELKNRNVETPNIERKMAIITAHSGLPKREQERMTYRSHTLLFEEICGEIEFTTVRPVALFGGKGSELDHWIFKKKKNKLDGYVKSVDSYTKSMGGSNNIRSSSAETGVGESYIQQFNNFTQK